MAATLDLAARNQSFQPGKAQKFAVLQPAQARVLGGEMRYPGTTVRKAAPVLLAASTRVEIGRVSFKQPRDVVVQPLVTKAGGK